MFSLRKQKGEAHVNFSGRLFSPRLFTAMLLAILLLAACSSSGGGDSRGAHALLTFLPEEGGVRIRLLNRDDFSSDNFQMQINATRLSDNAEFILQFYINDISGNDGIRFGLPDGERYHFTMYQTNTTSQELPIRFHWEENEREDEDEGGIYIGANNDEDRQADFVDPDDDNDGVPDLNSSGQREDNCPFHPNPEQEDVEGDSHGDLCDVDDDNDGLIEIATAAELDRVRYEPDGDGIRSSTHGRLMNTGCAGGGDCSGYELIANISLVDYPNWLPIPNTKCQGGGSSFSGEFNGNGFTVSNLNINRSGEDCVGLFGSLDGSAATSAENVHNLHIEADTIIGRNFVGGLAGRIFNTKVTAASVVVQAIHAKNNVGGLVGLIRTIGVGATQFIVASYVISGNISGVAGVGGMIGNVSTRNTGNTATEMRVVSSYAISDEVRGTESVGGLIGEAFNTASGNPHNGVGIYSSYALSGLIDGDRAVGGLVGKNTTRDLVINTSYWDSDIISQDNGLGEPRSTTDLQSQTDFSGIYEHWNQRLTFEDRRTTIILPYCDEDSDGEIGTSEQVPGNYIWDFGEDNQYPAIRCSPFGPAEQRELFFIDSP